MDLEQMLNEWMDEHAMELFEMMNEEGRKFREAHPGMDYEEERLNAMAMSSRRYFARALGQVLPKYLESRGG